ncbi:MAG: hypothetical protein HLUCCA01_04870 [Bacteroidetes bacterium HLUCCA01]|nr:MAG: hypothetical protein HLUCCA01_04870 [Bacteroidetes bacterium HLUCCA01]
MPLPCVPSGMAAFFFVLYLVIPSCPYLAYPQVWQPFFVLYQGYEVLPTLIHHHPRVYSLAPCRAGFIYQVITKTPRPILR